MSIHSFKYRLNSCKVDKALILKLENCFFEEAKNFLQNNENGKEISSDNSMYSVTLEDNAGLQKFQSINDYKENLFPNTIKSIVLDFNSYLDMHFHVRVNFDSSISGGSCLEISIQDKNAGEISKKIEKRVAEIVKGNRNYNFLFHSRPVQIGLIILYALFNIVNYFYLITNGFSSPYYLAYNIIWNLIFALFVIWFCISIFMCSYNSFYTKRQKVRSMVYGIISFLFVLMVIVCLFKLFSIR